MTGDLERLIARGVGGALAESGRWLAMPGNALSNFGVWLSNRGCPCEMCREERAMARTEERDRP
jgi:hypothetical protein